MIRKLFGFVFLPICVQTLLSAHAAGPPDPTNYHSFAVAMELPGKKVIDPGGYAVRIRDRRSLFGNLQNCVFDFQPYDDNPKQIYSVTWETKDSITSVTGFCGFFDSSVPGFSDAITKIGDGRYLMYHEATRSQKHSNHERFIAILPLKEYIEPFASMK